MPTKPNLIDRAIRSISPVWAAKRMAARFSIDKALSYKGADTSRLRNDWIIGTDSSTPDAWTLSTLRSRSRDLNRNDPVASGATETMSVNIVGQGLRPQARLRADRLGISKKRAKDLTKAAESIWQEWCPDADAANRLSFDEIQFIAIRKIIEDGEISALPIMTNEPWRKIKRCLELVEARRLTSHDDPNGIKLGRRGEPLSYTFKSTHPKTFKTTYKTIAARDDRGRKKVIHAFPTKRPGQIRGIPVFAPVLTYFKDLADYMEAEVVAARVAACLAVFITKGDSMTAGALSMGDTTDAAGNRIQGVEPGMVSYLDVGENINVVDPKRPGDSFSPFIESILRMIGMAIGMPYELLVKDFSKTNYSSARAALLEGRRHFMSWRHWFAQKFCQPIYDLVLEEAFLRGHFDAPNFYDNRVEYTRALWIGGGWGWVDPVKEVESSNRAIKYNLSTLAEEAAAQGRDWEEVLEQRKREEDLAKQLNLTDEEDNES